MITLKLINNNNKSINIISAIGNGRHVVNNAPQSDLLHWFGDLQANRELIVEANVIADLDAVSGHVLETRFFVASNEAA